MAGKSNTSATFFAQKKLLGKAHTSNLKTDGEELIGSNIQAASSLLFGEEIPSNPAQTLYLTQSAGGVNNPTVEYIPFILTQLTGTTYDANETSPDGGAGSDSGESSQSSGPHTYKFVFPSDYEVSSSNSRAGNSFFDNNETIHHSLGKVQLVPPFFSQVAPNPYIIKIYKDNGSGGIGDEIPLLDNIDWNVDFYNGILFLQDYKADKIPAHARAFAYIGKMLDEVVLSGSSGGGSGDASATYIVQTATGSLSAERVLTAGTGLKSADAGANNSFTLSVNNAVVATLTGSIFSGPVVSPSITGSLTKLPDGTSYLIAAAGVTIVTGANGSVTVSAPSSVFNEFLGTGDGSNTFFALDHAPTANKNVSVFVNGVLQMPATTITTAAFQDFSVTGSNVFFTTSSVPEVGSVIMTNYSTNEEV